MSLSRETVLEIMSLTDGELEGEARARVERLVASDAEARRVAEAMRASPIGGWLRGAAADRAAAATAGLADAVMAGIGAARPRARRPRRGPAVLASAGAGLALAAGVVLHLRSGRGRPGELAPSASAAAYASRPASAGEAARAPALEITEIYASQSDSGASVDPALRGLPQLARDPVFAGYNAYTVVARARRTLDVGKAAALPMADGQILHVTLTPASGAPGAEPRYRVRATVGERGAGAALGPIDAAAAPGEPLLVGGWRYRDGALFVALVLR